MISRSDGGRGRRIAAAVLSLGLAVVLGAAALDVGDHPGPLAGEATSRAAETGASNPVTAVLLGFRAYDTWLEVAVVLAGVVGVLAVARTGDVTGRPPRAADPVLAWMAALVVPAGVLAGGFFLWLGTSEPGGAFQAGSVLGASALLLWLAGRRSLTAVRARVLAPLMAAGTAAFLLAGAAPLIAGRALLDIPEGLATEVLIAVEAAVAVAVAVALPVAVLAARAPEGPTAPPRRRGRSG